MQIRDLIGVVAAVRLNQHHHMTESESVHGKAEPGLQVTGPVRRSPALLDALTGLGGDGLPPPLVIGEAQMIQWLTIQALRSIGATSEQALHQCLAIAGERFPTKGHSLLLKPLQDGQTAGGGVESHPVGQPTVPHRIVRQHQGHPPLIGVGLSQPHPTAGMIHEPADAVVIGNHPRNRGGEPGIIRAQITETAGPRAETGIQLRHDHLEREVQRCQSAAAREPFLPASSADQQLKHRQIQVIPQRTAEPGIRTAHGCEGRATDHDLNLFAAQQVLHSALNGGITQAAHPQKTWTEALRSQSRGQGFRKTQITALKQRAIEDDTDTRPSVGLPVPGRWVGHRVHAAGILRL